MNHEIVVFLCADNAGASQIAEALFNDRAAGRGVARSAGIRPSDLVSPSVTTALAEAGIDITAATVKPVTVDTLGGATVVVTMSVPPPPTDARVIAWDVAGPAGDTLPEARALVREIEHLVDDLLGEFRGRVTRPAPW